MAETKDLPKNKNGTSMHRTGIMYTVRARQLTDDQKRELRERVTTATSLFLKKGGKINRISRGDVTSNENNNPYELMFGGKWRD